MAIIDTLEIAQRLEDAGVNPAEAKAQAGIFRDVIEGIAVTKNDLEVYYKDTRAEIQSVRTELKTEIQDTRAELKAEIQDVRTELKADIAELDSKINGLDSKINGLDSKIELMGRDLTIRLYIGILAAIGAGAALLTMFKFYL